MKKKSFRTEKEAKKFARSKSIRCVSIQAGHVNSGIHIGEIEYTVFYYER